MRQAHDDPIGYVLSHLWADATKDGEKHATAEMVAACAAKDYATALIYAIAIELDKAKRMEHSRGWAETLRMLETAQIPKELVLDEVGHRTLFWFLAQHRNDMRRLRPATDSPPPPLPPTLTQADIDRALKGATK
jgi:hypothetical protein